MTLTVKEIENARPGAKPRKLSDGNGLYILVSPAGGKSWHMKFHFLGKEQKLSFGPFPQVSLRAARAKRDEARAALAEGRNPAREKRAAKLIARTEMANTFGAIARKFIEKLAAEGLADVTIDKNAWLLSLLAPRLDQIPIADINTPMLLSVLEEVATSGRRETARRLRSFAARIFDFAIITGRAQINPAAPLHRALLTPTVRHHPAIVEPDQLGELLSAIDSYGGYPSTLAALRVSAHLFQRPGEIRNMRWLDLDLTGACWKLPAAATKMRRAHEVPLSRQVLGIIGSQADMARGEFVFPAYHAWKQPISENAVNQALSRMGYKGIMTAHGFRSTASSLLNESGRWSPDIIEHALAHKDPNAIRAIYNRATYWDERVEMMQWWSDKLDELKTGAVRRVELEKAA